MSLIDLDFDYDELDKMQLNLMATDKEVRQSFRSALNRIAKYIKKRTSDNISERMGIPKSVLNQRMKNIKVKTQGPNMEIKLWMGLNPIDYMKLGAKQQPFETATGVQAGKRSLRLAFIATTKNNSGHVFRREGRDRLPIKKQTIPIASKVQNFVERRVLVSQKFDQMFLKFLDEELEKRVKKRQAK